MFLKYYPVAWIQAASDRLPAPRLNVSHYGMFSSHGKDWSGSVLVLPSNINSNYLKMQTCLSFQQMTLFSLWHQTSKKEK